MSALLRLLDVGPGSDDGSWIGPASGPQGKRAFGGQFMAQSLAAAARTVDPAKLPSSMHLQFLRGGEAGEEVQYAVHDVFDGRTTSSRRVESRQADRLLTVATVSFAEPLAGPEHGRNAVPRWDPEALPRTGPPGPAPSMPLQEIDIRVEDDCSGVEFVRRLWWRVTVVVPEDASLHTIIAGVRDRRLHDRPCPTGARSLDDGAHPPQRHHGFLDLVASAGSRRSVEPAGVEVTRGGPRSGRDHGHPGRRRWGDRRDPGAGGSHRRAGLTDRHRRVTAVRPAGRCTGA